MNGRHYTPHTDDEIREMLSETGVERIEDLFSTIPEELRARVFNAPPGMSEFEVFEKMKRIAADNSNELLYFIGGGFYDHLIPAVVDHLAGRSEFYTSYTPYQPECSQGTLQALFEYQTAICRLTGLDVSNASLYDGATACAEAALMAIRGTGRKKIIADGSLSPFSRMTVRSYLFNLDVELLELPPLDGLLNLEELERYLDGETAAVIIQNPNFFGLIQDMAAIAEKVHAAGALLIASVYPVSLGILKSPGECGVDIAVGDGQSLGNPLNFGGPSFGFIAARKTFIRNVPGRIVGETVDREGKRGFVLTLQAREQHIKREKATSNVCSNQGLCALRGLIFLSSLGKEGIARLASMNRDKAFYARELISRIPGVNVLESGQIFNEFTIAFPVSADLVAASLLNRGIAAGLPLGRYYEGSENCMVVTVTEKRSKKEIELLATAIGEALQSALG